MWCPRFYKKNTSLLDCFFFSSRFSKSDCPQDVTIFHVTKNWVKGPTTNEETWSPDQVSYGNINARRRQSFLERKMRGNGQTLITNQKNTTET